MTKTGFLLSLSLSGFAAGMAAPAAAADLGHGFTIAGGATLVSDYRFRGISQTDRRFAIQGTFTLSHSSGFYATVWGSSIDDYVADGGDAEVDLIAGWHHTWHGTTLDMGVLYYYYPGSGQIIHGYNSDFAEPYVSVAHAFGPVTAKATANYAPRQSALSVGNGNEDNLYLAGDLSAAIPHSPAHPFRPSRAQLRPLLPHHRRRLYRLECRRLLRGGAAHPRHPICRHRRPVHHPQRPQCQRRGRGRLGRRGVLGAVSRLLLFPLRERKGPIAA